MSSPVAPRFCGKCGAALRSQAKFCPGCGRQQPGYTAITHSGLLVTNHLLKQRYRIQQRLGEGGMGAVYQAQDTFFKNAKRAVKEMNQGGMNRQERDEAAIAFEQEAMLLADLVHPYLPRIYDHFEEAGRWYLVMDFIAGNTLGDRLEHMHGGKLPLAEVLDIGSKLATVLGYLHTRQPPIIFRDLKPANVMLTPEDDLYLIDFGIARLFKPGQTKDTVAFGSEGYAAPEQYGQAQTTPRSDIYSLGALLHQMLSGVDPSTNQPLLWDFKPLSPALPASLTQLITRMVNTRLEQRPASMQEIKQELQRIAGQQAAGSGTLAPASPVPPSAPLPVASQQPTQISPPQQKTKEQWLNEGSLYANLGRYFEALAAYDCALELDANYADAWSSKGSTLDDLQRYQEALDAYNRALQLDPSHAWVWNNKGITLNNLKRYQEALVAYEQALQLDPSYANAWNNKGNALDALQRAEEALAAYVYAVELDPDLTDAWNGKGNALDNLKRYQEALAAYEGALQRDPHYALAWNNKGSALNHLQRQHEALDAYEYALQLNPNFPLAWNNKGITLDNLKRYQEALAAYERALQLDPTYAAAWKNKGDALTKLHRDSEAKQAYQKALDSG